jgi:hypothetical protein
VSTDRETLLRISELERKVSDLYSRLGQAEPDPQSLIETDVDPRVMELIQAGKKIEAVQLYRQLSATDLASAHQAVEELSKEHGIIS